MRVYFQNVMEINQSISEGRPIAVVIDVPEERP
jgi:hypothetical protein